MEYCECMETNGGNEWVPIGNVGNIMDFQICDHCEKPIMGTQATHYEDDE